MTRRQLVQRTTARSSSEINPVHRVHLRATERFEFFMVNALCGGSIKASWVLPSSQFTTFANLPLRSGRFFNPLMATMEPVVNILRM